MKKTTLIILLASCNIIVAKADDSVNQLQQLNNTQARNENNLWQRMRDGFQLDHVETKEVKYWEKRYGNPKYFNIIMQNAAPYLYFVISEMERRGVPSELALIPIVESTYNPQAISPAAISTGMWQFVSSSGKRFGMTQNSDLDERKDIVKSTRAAITYLIYLHDMFGSWELAIAAYNWGEGNINNAINSSGSKNFYDLDVRDVTHQYVPKVIALANIIQNPDKFGIKLTDLNNSPYFGIVQPTTPTSLNDIMDTASISAPQFKKLNPQFSSNSYVAPQSQRILLPITNQNTYLASLGKTQTPGITPVIDDNAAQIAAVDLNQSSATAATTSQTGNDGINQLASAFNEQTTATSSSTSTITTATGAATVVVADNSQTATNNNSQTSSSSQINDLLNNNSPEAAPAVKNDTGENLTRYTVMQGDTLYSIARKFAVSVDDIKTDNQLPNNILKLNQILMIRSTQLQMKS